MKTLTSIIIIMVIFGNGNLLPQNSDGISIGDNFRIYPSETTQTEVFLVTHPTDINTMFGSANTIRFLPSFFVSEGVYVTTDGGNSWFGSDTCTGEIITFHGGDPGIAIDKDGRFILTRLGDDFFRGLFSHTSTDLGATWTSQVTISLDELERATVVSDADPLSNFYGRTYAAWVVLGPPQNPLYVSYTDDGGSNWSDSIQVNSPFQRTAGGEITIGPDGKLYTTWAVLSPASPFNEIFIGFASSSDGGVNWTSNESIVPVNGIAGTLTEKQNIRVNGLPRIAVDLSGGTRQGWIYIVTAQKNLTPAGTDPDIILYRSSNGGANWSDGIRVNQDGINNGNIQYFPAVHVDHTGGLNVIYYDDRFTTSDSTGVFLSRSTDGGTTWTDYQVSDHNFRPEPIGGLGQGYQGDNIDLNSAGNTLWPVWMDNSTGIYQMWTSRIDLSLVSIEEESESILPEKYSLKQNYPNPFNPVTVIQWETPESGWYSIKIYDILGNQVAEPVNGYFRAGSQQVTIDASDLTSGIYFYTLRTKNFTDTKKMILLR
ncbi:MAG: hypothetical protein Kow0098_16700 [Ignavibacteriaceae bacterium]